MLFLLDCIYFKEGGGPNLRQNRTKSQRKPCSVVGNRGLKTNIGGSSGATWSLVFWQCLALCQHMLAMTMLAHCGLDYL